MKSIAFDKFPQLSSRDKAYQKGEENLQSFVQYPFEYQSLHDAIIDRQKHPVDRAVLVKEVLRQYEGVEISESVRSNIKALGNENCFTVVTAHQPALFTGPLYFILKIASAINLARRMNEEKADVQIVPVFILGAEDHDFEEINHTYVFGKKIQWDRQASGSVGRLDLEGLSEVISEMNSILGESPHAKTLQKILVDSLKQAKDYGSFSSYIVKSLFDQYGLVVINFDNKAFKTKFKHLIEKEVLDNFSKDFVVGTQEKLSRLGFSDQAYAREINFFYLQEGARSRIEFNDGKYHVLGTEIHFTEDGIKAEIANHPERFSPNVVMRPLYQETILPNLAYIGGGGELAYWMERKSQFQEAEVFFPMLIRRNSALWVSAKNNRQLNKLDLNIEDLLEDTEKLVKEYALEVSDHDVDFDQYYDAIHVAYAQIKKESTAIDASLEKKVEAMKVGVINDLEKLQYRLIKTIKQQQDTKVNQLRKVKDSLFPDDSLQERKANFMEFYLSQGDNMIEELIKACDPFNKEFLIFVEE